MGVGKPRVSGLVAIALGSKRRMLRAASGYLAKHPAPRVLSYLAQHQCITTTELQPWTFQTGLQWRTLRVAGRHCAGGCAAQGAVGVAGVPYAAAGAA